MARSAPRASRAKIDPAHAICRGPLSCLSPVYIREGGSIPVCSTFEQILDLPVVLLGFDPPDQQAHAPNEWMDLTNYERGIRAVARMWDEVAALDGASLRRSAG